MKLSYGFKKQKLVLNRIKACQWD